MKINEIADPDRMPTGVAATTIEVPYGPEFRRTFPSSSIEYEYKGDPEGYRWPNTIQQNNYLKLKLVLRRNNLKLTQIWATTYQFYENHFARWVAIIGDVKKPIFVWEKYEGATPGGGQNRVYVAGTMLRLAAFLEMGPEEQDHILNMALSLPDASKDSVWEVKFEPWLDERYPPIKVRVTAPNANKAKKMAEEELFKNPRKFHAKVYNFSGRKGQYYTGGSFRAPIRIS